MARIHDVDMLDAGTASSGTKSTWMIQVESASTIEQLIHEFKTVVFCYGRSSVTYSVCSIDVISQLI